MMTKRILIVDDEEGYRKVLLNSLTDSGYETKAVKNGFEALEEIKRQRYSIILLDVKMPGMDGIELLEQIQGRKGAKKVITKPFSMDDIEACLSEL